MRYWLLKSEPDVWSIENQKKEGASGAIFGPAAIGGAINFVTDIDYENSLSFGGSDKRNNLINH